MPRHVAIIMDGNGRWAAERGLSRVEGHRAGTENVRGVIGTCLDWDIEVLTLYAFSTENWLRPRDEINSLFSILGDVIDRETDELRRVGVRVRHLGSLDGVPESLADRVRYAVAATRDNHRLSLNVAFNYGARVEILRAVRRIVNCGLNPAEIDEATISDNLYTAGQPDPDLIIRTAGEMRLSNFLLWQAAYAEYWCTEVYWPDLTPELFRRALRDFSRRQRRFGGLPAPAPAGT
ncbi:MAG: di-trans,poly-cis-decaprenylcistransferase [Chloroflexi bacterium]|nr:di-trans,poly-cis-decaprenylcistransferase [Chloroflexota bacterium]